MARVGSKIATRAALGRAQTIFSAHDSETIDRRNEIKTAMDVANQLGSMRGVMSKFGQILSYVSSPLAPDLRNEFVHLQDNAPVMSKDLVDELVENELGLPPYKLFDTWDPDPIASASIGQVHRAITNDGRAVALKVQFPNISETLTADLSNLRLLAKGFRLGYPSMDTDSMVDEIASRIGEELDYRLEAINQTLFHNYYKDHPFIAIPQVLPEYSTARVLCTELATGKRFQEFLQSEQAEKNLAAETIFRFVFRSLYQIRTFNGDPHPGNYLFNGSGKVTFLDFGLVKHFQQTEISLFETMVQSIVIAHSPEDFVTAITEAGLLSDKCDLDAQSIYDHFMPFYESVIENKPFRFSEQYTAKLFDHTFFQKAPIAKFLQVSPPFVIIQRINLGLYSILATLSAQANFRAIAEEIWSFTPGQPSTPMGFKERDWVKSAHG